MNQPVTVSRPRTCTPEYTCPPQAHLPTCAEEAIPERCPCLSLDAYPPIQPLPSFIRGPALSPGETAITGTPTAASKPPRRWANRRRVRSLTWTEYRLTALCGHARI
jgi:hypothetical protein